MRRFENVLFVIVSALSIVGAVVGVGFVSGKEIVSFFFRYGEINILLGSMVIVLLFVCINKTLKSNALKNNHKNKNRKTSTKYIKNTYNNTENAWYNAIISLLCLVVSATMIGGVESLLVIFGLGNLFVRKIVLLLVVILICFFLMKKTAKVTKISGIVAFILVCVMIICVFLGFLNLGCEKISYGDFGGCSVFSGICSVVFYVSMNMLSCKGVLVSISERVKSKKQIFFISLIASFLIGGLIVLVNILYCYSPQIVFSEMPLLELAKSISQFFFVMYLVVLFCGCVLALVSVSYSGVVCLKMCYTSKGDWGVMVYMMVAYLLSVFGFGVLIEYAYPLVGMVYLVVSLIRWVVEGGKTDNIKI